MKRRPATLVLTAAFAALGLTAALPRTASAETASLSSGADPRGGTALTAWGILPWHGIGAGLRYTMPLQIDPIIKGSNVRDEFALEFGADILHWSYGYLANDYGWTEVLPVVGIAWRFWLNDKLALYPKFDLGYALGWYSGWEDNWGNRPTYGGIFWDFAGGILYKTNSNLTLRAEAGYAGLKLGVAWAF